MNTDNKICDGARYVSDLLPLSTYQHFSQVNLTDLKPTDTINPCGNIAKYIFTDSFRLYRLESTSNATEDAWLELAQQIPINQTNISHSVDRQSKFIPNTDQPQWLDLTNGK